MGNNIGDNTNLHALEIFEKRNKAFRILYDTVFEIEGASTDRIFDIFTNKLLQISSAKKAIIASFDNDDNSLVIESIWVDGKKAKHEHSRTQLDIDSIEILKKEKISHIKKPDGCFVYSLCNLISKSPAKATYRLSIIRENTLLGVAIIQMGFGKKLVMKDMIDTFLNLCGTIIERINAVRSLKNREEWIYTTLRSIGDAVIATDMSGNITFMNIVAENLTGWKLEEASGKNIKEVFRIVNEKTGEEQESPIDKVLRTNQIITLANHTALVNREGEEVPIEDSAAPIRNDQGYVTGVVLVFHDITNLKKSENNLRDSLQMIETILDTMPNPVFYKDSEGIFLNCNKSFSEQILGFSKEEIIGKTLEELSPEQFGKLSELHHVQDLDLISSISNIDFDSIIPCPDGERRYYHISKAAFADSQGKPAGIVGAMNDLTYRKKTEDELRASKEFLDSVIENIPNMVFVKESDDLKFVRFNRAGEIGLGLNRSEILGKGDKEIFSKNIADQMTRDDYEVLQSGKLKDIQEEIILPISGEKRIYHTKKIPIIREDDEYKYLLGISEDITDEKEKELELRRTHAELNQIFNAATALCVIDLDFNMVKVNDTFCNVFQYDRKDILNKKCYEVWGKDICDRSRCPMKMLNENKELAPIETYKVLPDDSKVYTIITSMPYRDVDGKIIGIVENFVDITKLKEATDARRKTEDRLNIAVSAASIGLWEIDIQSMQVSMNSIAQNMLGYETGELDLEFNDVVNTVFSVETEQFLEQFQLHLQGSTDSIDMEHPVKMKSGEVKWFFISGRIISNELSHNTAMVGIIMDIDDRKKVEHDLIESNITLKQTQKAMIRQEKMASIGQLSAGVAHEINNPLGFVSSNFSSLKKYVSKIEQYFENWEILESSLKDLNNEIVNEIIEKNSIAMKKLKIKFVLEDLEEIICESEEGFERMKSIVRNLKTFSRIEDSDSFELYSLNEAIENTLVVARNEIKYVANVHKELGDIDQIRCHGSEINQVLLNLIVNSAQAIGKSENAGQGVISIMTYQNSTDVFFEISDNGPGIPLDNLHKIFDPFFTTKEQGEGTGLGLYISYDIIVNKHNGNLEVSNNDCGGATFTIRLPKDHDSNNEAVEL